MKSRSRIKIVYDKKLLLLLVPFVCVCLAGCGTKDVLSLEDLAMSVSETSETGGQDGVGAGFDSADGSGSTNGSENLGDAGDSYIVPPEKVIARHCMLDAHDRVIFEETFDEAGRQLSGHYTSGYEAIYEDDTFTYTWSEVTSEVQKLLTPAYLSLLEGGRTATVTKQDGSLYRIYQYDAAGVLRFYAWFVEGELYQEAYYNSYGQETQYVYSQHSNLGTSRSYDENGHLTCISYVDGQSDQYENDENGNVLVNRWYNKKGKVRRTTTYTYDEQGRVLSWREHRVDDKDEEDQRRFYEYDEEGRLIFYKNVYFGGETYDYNLYFYDENGNLIRDDFYQLFETVTEPVKMDTVEYTYDRYGHLLTKTESWAEEVIYTETHSYELDSEGCVIKDMQYRNGDLFRVETYAYY